MTTLTDRLDQVVGGRAAAVLGDVFGLRTVGDLLRHYPRRYARRGELTELSSLREGEHVTVLAEVVSAVRLPNRHRRGERLEVVVTDGTARLVLTFFNRVGYWHRLLRPGVQALCAGEVSSFRGRRQLVHPDCEVLPDGGGDSDVAAVAAEYAAELIPVYPASARIASWQIARAVQVVLDTLDVDDDPLPVTIRRRYGLCGRLEALRAVHRPSDEADVRRGRHRIKWEEAFVLQAALARRRAVAATSPAVGRPRVAGGIAEAFDAALPFPLTAGQRRVGEEIAADLARTSPMHRLLQGEVGSGKTVVAVRAMLQVVDAGGQAALLAPTEVLAQQHHRSITAMLGPLGRAGQLDGAERATRVALLTGSQGAAARRDALAEVASGQAGIVVGTHALLEDAVRFADLGLVVIDEQHRFGVEQRDALRAKVPGGRPHLLVMTATPIPRTVAMTVYGDLEVSTLTELPAGRAPIATHVVPAAEKPRYLQRAWQRVREEVGRGRQAYVVCPRIGGGIDGDDDQAAAVAGDGDRGSGGGDHRPASAVFDVAPALARGPLAGLRVAALHGRLPPDDKDRVMREFAAGAVDVLVATTVVEVGVDVPNATVMVVLDADRFGVSQLHQLRGRVGRGAAEGLCLLVTEAEPGSPSRARLDAVAATGDGFALSRLDLQQRGEGDVLGVAQAGRRSSLLLSLLDDEELIRRAREEAGALVARDPGLTKHPELAAAIDDLLDPRRAEFLDKT